MLPPRVRCGVLAISLMATLTCVPAAANEFAAAGAFGVQFDALWARPHPDFPDAASQGDFIRHIEQGNAADVIQDLRFGAEVNLVGRNGLRPIFIALANKSPTVTRLLLAAGADPNVQLKDGTVPLQLALVNPNADFTRALLTAGANANVNGSTGRPMIHYAAVKANAEQLRLLNGAGADMNAVWGGKTALLSAISGKNWDAATALVDGGVDASWHAPGKKIASAPAEFCDAAIREQNPGAVERRALGGLFDAFKKRGVKLSCARQAIRFR